MHISLNIIIQFIGWVCFPNRHRLKHENHAFSSKCSQHVLCVFIWFYLILFEFFLAKGCLFIWMKMFSAHAVILYRRWARNFPLSVSLSLYCRFHNFFHQQEHKANFDDNEKNIPLILTLIFIYFNFPTNLLRSLTMRGWKEVRKNSVKGRKRI